MRNVWKSNRKYDYGEGQYMDGFGDDLDKTVTHKRSIKFVKNKYWIVEDTFIPSDKDIHTYETWFHFNTPSYGIDENTGVVYSNAPNAANIAIVHIGEGTVSVVTGQKTPEIQGSQSISGGGNGYKCVPVATPVYHTTGKGVIKEIYMFIPYTVDSEFPVINVKKQNSYMYFVYLIKDGKKTKLKLKI